MTDRELLEHILFKLRVANWQRAGGKKAGDPPKPPQGQQPARSFGGRVVNTYNINATNMDEALRELKKRENPPGAVA